MTAESTAFSVRGDHESKFKSDCGTAMGDHWFVVDHVHEHSLLPVPFGWRGAVFLASSTCAHQSVSELVVLSTEGPFSGLSPTA